MIKIKQILFFAAIIICSHTGYGQDVKLGLPLGHSSGIEDINFSPDGKYIVTASEDKQVIIWDVRTGKPVQLLIGHKFGVTSAKFSDDGKTVISTSIDGTVKFWDVFTGKVLSSFNHPGTVISALITKDQKYFSEQIEITNK